MDRRVKNEAEEIQQRTMSFSGRRLKSAREEDLTLAQLSHTPNLNRCSSGRKKKKDKALTERKEKRKKSQSESIIKPEVSDPGGKHLRSKKNNGVGDNGKCTPEIALIRAQEVQSNLGFEFPCFTKALLRSHVGGCFWMAIPMMFCQMHLPKKDSMFVLEDESGGQLHVKYYADKMGLGAGWRQFCGAHKLLEGDVLVFQLLEPTKFKVYIIRANDLTELDGALGLLNLDAHTKQSDADDAENGTRPCRSTKRKRPKSLPLAVVQKKNKSSGLQRLACTPGQPAEQSENDSEEVGSEVLEGFKLSVPTIQFKDITSFEQFNILVDGLVIDPELSEEIRNKYYTLCCSQSSFLHENIIQGINFKLIAGIISETVNIADAIRACTLTTSHDEFDTLDKTLKAFEHLGMNVGFLRTRLHQLVNLVFESEGGADTRRYIEAKKERAQTEDEIRNLESKLAEVKEAYKTFGLQIENLQSKAETFELRFQEEAEAPW